MREESDSLSIEEGCEGRGECGLNERCPYGNLCENRGLGPRCKQREQCTCASERQTAFAQRAQSSTSQNPSQAFQPTPPSVQPSTSLAVTPPLDTSNSKAHSESHNEAQSGEETSRQEASRPLEVGNFAEKEVEKDKGCCTHCAVYGTVRGNNKQGYLITMCEVKRHNSADDLWIIARKSVFDVTTYMDQHPGGRRSLLRRAGGVMDCAEDFDFHSKKGQRIWERFRIGRLVDCSSPPTDDSCVIL